MATTPALDDALLDFTSRENWDKFFALRGDGDSFEWYAEWPQIKAPLLSLLLGEEGTEILVPGCGSSSLSEQLYDLGFRRITNVDFSRVIVADMLRRHARVRPQMRWRVMDMTNMQFPDGSFDFILDKGGLDALMEPEVGTKLGMKYLDEAKRVLKLGGKFACFTLAESHVLDLLLSEFRFGWDMTIQAIASEPSSKSAFQTFMVVMVKGKMGVVHTIKSLVDQSAEYCNMQQANAVIHALQNENKIRESHNSGVDILFSLRDLQLGAIGDLKVIVPGRRRQLILGEQGSSLYCYKAVLMDAKNQTETFAYHCGVFIVPKARAQEWLFASEEGQWLVVESAKAARLIMVFLDSRHASADIDVIKKDLSPLVMDLEPEYPEETDPMPFMMASDGVKQRDVLQEVTSEITGPMVVEDVLYENVDGDQSCMSEKMFRRLIFKRSSGLVQSEALLMRESPSDEMDSKTKNSSTSSKKKSQKKGLTGSKDSLRVDHSYLGSSYHSSIICGLSLVASALSAAASSGERVSTTIVGLGAGSLPMFLRGCLPHLDIEVVELDPVMEEVATKYFGFSMDEQLKVHLGDGIKFIEENAHSERNGKDSDAVRILIVDVDSSDLSSGLSCPPANFVEDAFLMSAKKFLSAGGLLIINLVARSSAVREMVVSRLKAVFENLYSLQLEEDVNEVLFASPSKRYLEIDHLDEAATKLKAMLKFPVDVESDMKNLQRLR
ncbi:eEF1A lysine and N-terminal methyltransferase-like [Triticum urartu]|uniref:Methyltransferase type 11 domain-containing protein n=1 Tax=Triticum urartu TaxID=4572 RepID=A0A8R7RCQ0_TRIUA|nr:eEF1A lysine and N-terminal methyltransferase-like [Triticum urartu]XP_048557019.1 eEF1A lysine and N-terminal methyltransferase-like [Triticum urartu]